MANKDFPGGMRVYDEGGAARPRLTPYKVATSTTIYANAPVIRVADGTVAMTSDVDHQGFVGVAAHPIVSDTNNIQTVMVFDDPQQKFVIQADEAGTALAATDVGLLYEFSSAINTQFGSTRYSNCELDTSTGASSYTDEPLRLLGLVERIDNAWGANADVIVMFNQGNHVYGTITSGI